MGQLLRIQPKFQMRKDVVNIGRYSSKCPNDCSLHFKCMYFQDMSLGCSSLILLSLLQHLLLGNKHGQLDNYHYHRCIQHIPLN